MTTGSDVHVRRFEPGDLPALHAMNEAAVPAMNSLTEGELTHIIAMSAATFIATDAGGPETPATEDVGGRSSAPLGFIVMLPDGVAYESTNYGWLSARFDRFVYVDRIAVDSAARGRGVGRALYDAVFRDLAALREVCLCEVNLEPPNPVSTAFHKALGFAPFAERWEPDRAKGVQYFARRLADHAPLT